MQTLVFEAPLLGRVRLQGETGQGLAAVDFQVPEAVQSSSDPLLNEVQDKINRYLAGESVDFATIPLALTGTPFQKAVWQALQSIPHGETRTYTWLAQVVGSPKGVRAVGQANGKNPLPLVIPCHRVVQKSGALGGYSAPGGGTTKQQLLDLESRTTFSQN